MTTNTFTIVVGKTPADSRVDLDGVELHGVRRVSFELDATQRDLSFIQLEIYGEAVVEGEYVERLIAASAQPEPAKG